MKLLAALCVVLAAGIVAVARQPVTASWARYADADSIYAGSGISILDGDRTKYVDHPGMPLQALAAVTFGVQYAVYKIGGGNEGLHAYASDTMLHLDRTRVWFRGWAIVIFLAGALGSVLLVSRLLRSVMLGAAAGLSWIALPGAAAMSIQLRPDVALAGLCIAVSYLIATASQRRDAGRLALAALTLGFALTVKIHAAGMLVPLALVAVFRAPADGWWESLRARSRDFVRRRRIWLGAAVAVWIALILLLNVKAWPFGPAPSQRVLVVEILAALALYWLAALGATRLGAPRWVRTVVGPFPALVMTLVAVGTALGLSLVLSDATLTLQAMKNSLTGQGVNTGVPLTDQLRASLHSTSLGHWLLYAAFTLATCAMAYRRRTFWPVALLAGSAVLTLMAFARSGGEVHYRIPGYAVGGIVALWLVSETRVRALQPLAIVGAALLAAHAIADRPTAPIASACGPSVQRARALLRPGQVAIAPRQAWIPDIEYHVIVDTYVSLVPPYPYRFVLDSPTGLAQAKALGLRPRYAIEPALAHARDGAVRTIGTAGRFTVHPVFRSESCALAAITPA